MPLAESLKRRMDQLDHWLARDRPEEEVEPERKGAGRPSGRPPRTAYLRALRSVVSRMRRDSG